MRYPVVLSEEATLDAALNGKSIARYGDGELRLALGGKAISQEPHPKLAAELRAILNSSFVLPCIPRVSKDLPEDKKEVWAKYRQAQYVNLYDMNRAYGSAFITRPDSAPNIDNPDYWRKVKQLWDGKDVTLVIGSERSLTTSMMHSARSARVIEGLYHHSYKIIDDLERQIGTPRGTVILCIGATATVLADRLARKGVHAVDLGHIGMFMRAEKRKEMMDAI